MSAAEADRAMPAGNGAFAFPLLDPDVDIPPGVTNSDGSSAPKRYGVYRNNVVVSLIEALKSAYPSLLVIMGEENFARVARNFISSHPPRSAMMQTYGEGFAGFLDGFAPLQKSPFLGDVARVERAWLEAYHAADAKPLAPGDLEGLAPEEIMQLRLARHPAAFVIRSKWPVADLFGWRDGRPKEGANLQKPQCVAVGRPALAVTVNAIDASLFVFLSGLLDGQSMEQAASHALEEDTGLDLTAAISFVISSGLFSGRRIGSE